MWIKLWERLRGYDKWTETEAEITSSIMEAIAVQDGNSIYQVRNMLEWKTAQKGSERVIFLVPEDSSFYQCAEGEKIRILYDPQAPYRYYCPDLLRSRIQIFLRRAKSVALFIGIPLALLGILKLLAAD